jgi:UDP-galactopyranose mutase
MAEALSILKEYNLFGLGRWGQWQYLNVDHCIKQVLDFFENESNYKFYDTIS